MISELNNGTREKSGEAIRSIAETIESLRSASEYSEVRIEVLQTVEPLGKDILREQKRKRQIEETLKAIEEASGS